VRVVFLGSPPFGVSVFEHVAASAHQVIALVTLPDRPRGRGRLVETSPLVEAARARSIEVLQPANPSEPAFHTRLVELAPDVLVVASYGVLLKQPLLELAPHGALNVHASLLPRWRGASPIQTAIASGDRETGVSIQKMVLALDEGDVLIERRTPIDERETAGELSARLSVIGGEALVEALDQLASGRAKGTPQDPTRATYARKIKKEHGRIDWTRTADELDRFVRAMNPWPLARSVDPTGRELGILRARVDDGGGVPGEILAAEERFLVACGKDVLEIQELVPAGKRALAARDFLRGARLQRGGRMGNTP
jgi:methionyl-tRNA formyltransferase